MPSHLAWTLFDFFDDYDPTAAQPVPPPSKDDDPDEDEADAH